jgi:AraC-like DNA-binding protein
VLYLELPAPAELSAVVHCFWFLRSDATHAPPQPVVADGRFEIILHAAEPFARLDDAGRPCPQGEALIAGQLTRPIHLVQQGPADIVGIRLRTAAATALFRHPLHELTNQADALQLVHRDLRDALLRALARSTDPVERRAFLSAALQRHMCDGADALTRSAVRSLNNAAPQRIAVLAKSLGTTTRTLERRIAAATGLTPRALGQTLRFRRVYRRLQEAGPGEMTRVALDAGYFDQAHCIREFRRFAGLAPTEFFRLDPTLATAFVASVQSADDVDRHL